MERIGSLENKTNILNLVMLHLLLSSSIVSLEGSDSKVNSSDGLIDHLASFVIKHPAADSEIQCLWLERQERERTQVYFYIIVTILKKHQIIFMCSQDYLSTNKILHF